MPVRWGRAVSRPPDIGGPSIVYNENVSSSSGGAAAVTFPADHNLNVSPRIYGATLLSHASAGDVTVTIGRINQSQMEIHLLGQGTQSGTGAATIVSGLSVHAYAVG